MNSPAAAAPLGTLEHRLQLLIEAVADYAIFMLDPTGHVISWNAGAESLKGYTRDEIIGRHFSIFYTPEAIGRAGRKRSCGVAQERGRFEDEGWRVRKDGTRFWANVVITALRDADGRARGFAKVTRDLTERRAARGGAARRARSASGCWSRACSDYAIFMLDPDGLVRSWNAGAERIKGYAADEIIGQHFSRFYPPEDQRAGKPAARAASARTADGRVEDEGWRVRKDGTRFWANVVITAAARPRTAACSASPR